jgi:ribonucleoside-diphosphate reductase alpha chain
MSVAELQKYTAVSKSARHVAELSRRETWPETVGRSAEMMRQKYPGRASRISSLYDDYVLPTKVLPSMRGLQFGGPPCLKHEARMFNCWGSYVDRLSFFGEAFYILLCGGGVGYSVQERHARSLPGFSRARLSGRKLPRKVFRPDDSIEGWADCSHALMTSYHERPVPGFEGYLDCEVEFDLSVIRKKNSPLSYGVGRAPGPMPLARAMHRNRTLLDAAVAAGVVRMTDELASDVHLNNSDAVVSGGVRRSANICIFDLSSRRMRDYKTGNWRELHPQRARANISAMLVRGGVSWEEFWELFGATREFGEPGFWWADDPDYICNPCAEIQFFCRLLLERGDPDLARLTDLYDGPVLEVDGKTALSGWQACNLTTVNGRLVDAPERLYEHVEAASELGTYQAGFDHFPYLGEITDRIVRREALLGVSIAGIMHNPAVMLDPDVLGEAALRVRRRNEEVAPAVGINPAARLTCEKPDGNSASTLGSFSGVGGGKIRRGFRIAQTNRQETPYQHFRSVNPQACEPSCWSPNQTDDVIRFCVEYDGVLEDEMTAVEFLENVRTVQKHWVGAGTVPERCVRPGLHHNVSNTVKVRAHEWEGVARHIYEHREDFGGVSFISAYGDRDYPQAPYTPVFLTEELVAAYGGAGVVAAGDLLDEWPGGPSYELWNWCEMALGIRDESDEARGWVAALKSAAGRDFGGDLRKAVYAVKDAYNLRLYRHLKATYREVDWSAMVERESGVDFAGEVACASGACET